MDKTNNTLEFRCRIPHLNALGWAKRVDAETLAVQIDGENRTDWWHVSQVESADVREAA